MTVEGTYTLLAKLFARTIRSGECRIWLGATNGKYPKIQRRGRAPQIEYVHRIVCEIVHGLGPGQLALHRCDTPRCIEPFHLFPGTYSDNTQDSMAKGRHSKPPRNDMPKLAREGRIKSAKLWPDDIREIRRLLEAGIEQPEIAKQFGVGSRTISKINRGHRWSHVQ